MGLYSFGSEKVFLWHCPVCGDRRKTSKVNPIPECKKCDKEYKLLFTDEEKGGE